MSNLPPAAHFRGLLQKPEKARGVPYEQVKKDTPGRKISDRSTRARSRTPFCADKSVKFLASYQSSASVLVRLCFVAILGGWGANEEGKRDKQGRTRVLISSSFPCKACLPVFSPSLYAVLRRPGTILSERERQGVFDT